MPVETPLEESAARGALVPVSPTRSVPAPRPGAARPVERSRGRVGSARPGGRRGGPQLPEVRQRVRAGAPGGSVPLRPSPVIVRRRRIAALTLGLVLVVLVGVAVALARGGAVTPGGPSAVTTVTVVGAGESLTDVARRASPGADPTVTVERIRELNGLSSSALAAGRPLVVPAG